MLACRGLLITVSGAPFRLLKKVLFLYKNKSEKHEKNYKRSKKIKCQNTFPCHYSVLGMRQSHNAAASTRLVRLPLLSHPPATRISPLGSSVDVQDDRGEGKSPTFFQLFVAGW